MEKKIPTMAITADNGGITEDSHAATATDDPSTLTDTNFKKKTESFDVNQPFEGKQMIVDVDIDIATPQKPLEVEEEEVFTPSPKKIIRNDFEMKEKMFSDGTYLVFVLLLLLIVACLNPKIFQFFFNFFDFSSHRV